MPGADSGLTVVVADVVQGELLPADIRGQVGEVLISGIACIAVPRRVNVDGACLDVCPKLLQTLGKVAHSFAELPVSLPISAEPVRHPTKDIHSGQRLDGVIDPCRRAEIVEEIQRVGEAVTDAVVGFARCY
ncbi:hypothetical protein GCM10023322_52720 [Rugosimonospora acidiphila]|uniref:Uncharacterized protein n=1 Tax=Rugosimonospora acidiphila TaxID=556531 RepID=A0ABP9S843_9ACTN